MVIVWGTAYDCVWALDQNSLAPVTTLSLHTGTLETAIHFVIYEHLKKVLVAHRRRELELTECMAAAAAAKMTASSLCYPHGTQHTHTHRNSRGGGGTPCNYPQNKPSSILSSPEVCRTRLRQNVTRSERRYHNFLQTLRVVWAEEGMAGLYGGMGAHLVRVVPNTAIVFFTYEAVVRILERRRDNAAYT